MAVALEEFVKQLEGSGVISPGKLESFVPPRAHPKTAEELARQLVASKQLSRYQAREIYQGRAKSLLLGNYTIIDTIGAGGMGQVFKAEHRRMRRTVAIKVLPRKAVAASTDIARFEREVEAAAKLEHPNIVAAYDADEADGVHFLVMQFVDGSDLSAVVKKNGPLPVLYAVNYVLQAAYGLAYAHAKHVVHRDIKPANLLLDQHGTVRILDMGLARIEGDFDAATQAELTCTGAVMGTVDYMAPEQSLSTKNADARADIYSLGCTLYFLLTGKPIYEGDIVAAKLLAHHQQPIPELGALIGGERPDELQRVFSKMVAKQVGDRYQTMNEVAAALESLETNEAAARSETSLEMPESASEIDFEALSFLKSTTCQTIREPQGRKSSPTRAAPPPKRPRRSKKWIAGAVAGVALCAVALAVVLKLRTGDGMLTVTINQPDTIVQVLDSGKAVEISQRGGNGKISIAVDPGEHQLRVEKDGFRIFTKEFSIKSGDTLAIAARLEPFGAGAAPLATLSKATATPVQEGSAPAGTASGDQPWNRPEFVKWTGEVGATQSQVPRKNRRV